MKILAKALDPGSRRRRLPVRGCALRAGLRRGRLQLCRARRDVARVRDRRDRNAARRVRRRQRPCRRLGRGRRPAAGPERNERMAPGGLQRLPGADGQRPLLRADAPGPRTHVSPARCEPPDGQGGPVRRARDARPPELVACLARTASPASQPIYMPGSHHRWAPIATAESWDGGTAGQCNGFLYRFRQVSIAQAPGGGWQQLVARIPDHAARRPASSEAARRVRSSRRKATSPSARWRRSIRDDDRRPERRVLTKLQGGRVRDANAAVRNRLPQ